METTVKQRIKNILSINNISITALSKAINVPQPTLNRQINSDAPMTLSNILLILNYFPSISAEWLLRGTGNMELSEESEPTDSLENDYVVNVLTTALEDIHTLVELQKDKIQALEMELESYTKKANVS